MNPISSLRFRERSSSGRLETSFGFDRDFAAIGMIEQTEDVKQRALAAAGWTDDRVHRSRLERE